jgi:hypothetical protein
VERGEVKDVVDRSSKQQRLCRIDGKACSRAGDERDRHQRGCAAIKMQLIWEIAYGPTLVRAVVDAASRG